MENLEDLKDENIKDLTFAGKIFLSNIIASALGRKTNIKFRGSKEEIDCIQNALFATKEFNEELKKPNPNIEDVIEKLIGKKQAAEEFERCLKIKFPL
jgi:hypothetical protein